MMTTNRWIGAALSCAIVFSAVSAYAQDWPQWRGPNRDGKVTGFVEPKAWPKELAPKWKVTVGLGDAGPVLVGDKLYVFARQGDEEVTLCLDAKDGNEIWRDKFKAQAISGPAAREHSGPRSTPAVADGKVVTLGISGTLSCLDAAKGTLVWRKEEVKGAPRFFTSSSPIVVDGLVIAQLGGADGAIVAYDLAKGDEEWKSPGLGAAYSSPVLLTADGVKQIAAMTEKEVVGVAVADGKVLWRLPFPVSGMAYNAATPVVDGATVIYTGQGRGTTAVKIAKKGDAFEATKVWDSKLATKFDTPVLKDGLLFGSTDRGNLFCIDAKTGSGGWTDSANQGEYGATLDAGSAILNLNSKGELVAFKPSAEKYDELAKIKAPAGAFGCPVVAGNKIFVKDKDTLTMSVLE
jgi:outer membrane protein assembly factor BamB